MDGDRKRRGEKIIDATFKTGVFIKGLDGVLEIAGGAILFFVNPAALDRAFRFLTAHELARDPHDFIVNFLAPVFRNLSLNAELFGAAYLVIHGLIKLFLVISLLKHKKWAYPAATVFFLLFIVFELYRYSLSHFLPLLALAIFDAFVLVLVWLEYGIRFHPARLADPVKSY